MLVLLVALLTALGAGLAAAQIPTSESDALASQAQTELTGQDEVPSNAEDVKLPELSDAVGGLYAVEGEAAPDLEPMAPLSQPAAAGAPTWIAYLLAAFAAVTLIGFAAYAKALKKGDEPDAHEH